MADSPDFVGMTADIVVAYLDGNKVAANDLPALIASVHRTLQGVDGPAEVEAEEAVKLTPAQIRKSITEDGLISFVDGKKYKTLKRHLTTHGLTVAAYKEKFGLPADYPTTSPAYSRARSEMARSAGLGTKGGRGRTPAKAAPKAKATSR